ncbi:MAG: hypothetical protein KC931_17245 [Candidatus Omnitrophica bacterium]|nr:hypothetical protein [Candidatus Omnitrophota bacterium]
MKTIVCTGVCVVLVLLCLAHSGAVWSEDLQQRVEGKKIRVFLLAGQSNMEGRADGRKLSEEDRQRLAKARERVQLAYNHEPIAPLHVTKPHPDIERLYQRDRIFGPELFFGIALSEAWPEERILLIKRAEGATSLYGCWNPEWSQENATLMGEGEEPKLYEDFIHYIKQVLSAYKENEYEICGMLWVQGESDSRIEEAASQYGENLRNLINHLRKDLNNPTLPFMLFQVGQGEVVKGMKHAAKEIAKVTLLPQSKKKDSADFYTKMENGHYDSEGMKKLGNRFADVFLKEYAHYPE